jgi:hypothetical protein
LVVLRTQKIEIVTVVVMVVVGGLGLQMVVVPTRSGGREVCRKEEKEVGERGGVL